MTVDLQDLHMTSVRHSTDLDMTDTAAASQAVTQADTSPEPVIKKWRVWKRIALLSVSAIALWALIITVIIWVFG